MLVPWHDCEVLKAGPAEDGVIYIMLRDSGGKFPQGRWFNSVERMKKEMLATALAAMSSGRRVDAALQEPPNEYTELQRLYIKR
jgi:hypothetical protein